MGLLTTLKASARSPVASNLKLSGNRARSPGGTITNGLVAYYPMGETSGTRVDVVNPGPGLAAQLTRANSERLTAADSASLSTGDIDFTIGGWFYKDSAPAAEMFLAGKFAVTGNAREYGVFFNSAGILRFTVSNDGTATGVADAGTVTTTAWHFVLGWHDSVNNLIWIQVDNGTPVSAVWTAGVFDSATQFALGVRDTSTSAFDGRLSCWFFGKRVYTAAERTALYNNGLPRLYRTLDGEEKTSLIAYWELNEFSSGAGAISRLDSHSNGITLTDNNTTTSNPSIGNGLSDVNTVTSVAGQVGTAAVFTLANTESLNGGDLTDLRSSDTDWEWNGWVYLAATATNQTIFSKDTGSASNREFRLDFLTATSKMTWIVYDGSSAIGTVTTTGTFNATTFYWVRVWHDATNNQVGIEVNRGTADTAATSGAASSGTPAAFRFGANGSGTPQQFGGRTDEWARFRRILSSTEADAIYNSGTGKTYPLL